MQGSRGQASEELAGGDKVISVRHISIESSAMGVTYCVRVIGIPTS